MRLGSIYHRRVPRLCNLTTPSPHPTEPWCVEQHYLTLFFFYVGVFVNAILLASVSAIILSLGVAAQAFQDRMRQVEDYMRSQRLDVELRDQVRDFFKAKYADGLMVSWGDSPTAVLRAPSLLTTLHRCLSTTRRIS